MKENIFKYDHGLDLCQRSINLVAIVAHRKTGSQFLIIPLIVQEALSHALSKGFQYPRRDFWGHRTSFSITLESYKQSVPITVLLRKQSSVSPLRGQSK